MRRVKVELEPMRASEGWDRGSHQGSYHYSKMSVAVVACIVVSSMEIVVCLLLNYVWVLVCDLEGVPPTGIDVEDAYRL